MKKVILLSVLVIILCGCAAKVKETGFLSNYSNLQAESDTLMRYIAPNNAIGNYSKFIIDPITVKFYDKETAEKVKPEDVEHLKQYMYTQVSDVLSKDYTIVTEPGQGVARIRMAITNLKQSTPALNVLPQTKLTGLGLGETCGEMELVDSVTGAQLAAAIESKQGNRLSFDGLSKWGDVEGVMRDWAKRMKSRIDEAHGKK